MVDTLNAIVVVDLILNLKMRSTWSKFVVYLVLIVAACPSLTQQELIPGVRRLQVNPQAAGTGAKLSSLVQHNTATFSGMRHSEAATTGNVTLEHLSQSLVRLEENLASLIQSFLTVQRSVFNLEQLQELLVLLLEDILKQTGRADKIPNRDAEPTQRSGDTGGAGLINDSSDSDSRDTASTEDRDDLDDRKVAATPGDNAGIDTAENGRNSGRETGNDLAIGPFQAAGENMSGPQTNHNVISSRHETGSSGAEGKGDSAEESSEGDRSNSHEDFSGYMTAMKRSTQPAEIPISSSQKPQWSEPLIVHTPSNVNSRFFDVVQRIASRLGQSAVRNSSPRLLGYTQMNSVPQVEQAETQFDRLPAYEPLEIIPAHGDIFALEKKHKPQMIPIKIKLHQESVISHGGPISGPEQFSSPFLEHPEEHNGTENTGERPTGMINDLVLSHGSQSSSPVKDDGNMTSVDVGISSMQSGAQIPVPDIRRKRHAHNNSSDDTQFTIDHTATTLISLSAEGNEYVDDSSTLNGSTPSTHSTFINTSLRVIAAENNVSLNEFHAKNTKDDSIYPDFMHALTQGNKIMDYSTMNRMGTQEYDVLIADFLSDLSTKLHHHYMNQPQRDLSTQDVINRVDSELSKLIWIPVEDPGITSSPEMAKTSYPKKESKGSGGITKSSGINDVILQTFPISESLNGKFDEKLKRPTDVGNSTSAKTSNLSNIHASIKMSEHLAKLSSIYKRNVTPGLDISSTPNTDVSIKATYTTTSSGLGVRDTTNNTYTDWDWLHQLINSTRLPDVDWEWLTDALAQIASNESFAEDMKALNNRGRALLDIRSYAGGLISSISSEVVSEINNITNDDSTEVNGDIKLTSIGDNSASSEDKDDKIDKVLTEVGETDTHGLAARVTKREGDVRNTNALQNLNKASKEDKDNKESGSNASSEDSDAGFDITIGDQDVNREIVYEKDSTRTNTDYTIDNIVSTQFSHRQAQLNVPPTRLIELLLARGDQPSHRTSEFLGRHPRASEHNMNVANLNSRTPGEHKQYQFSAYRQKRQTGILWNKNDTINANNAQFAFPQQTYAPSQERAGNESVYTNQKEANITLHHQQTTKNNETISQNSSPSPLNADLHNTEINSPILYPNSAFSNSNSHDGGPYSQHNRASAHDPHYANSQPHDQRASDVHSFQFPLTELANNTGYNSQYLDSTDPTSTEPGEAISAEERSVMDLEDILSTLFMTYWQQFYNLYTRMPPLTTSSTATNVSVTVSPALTTVTSEMNANFTSTDIIPKDVSNATYKTAGNAGFPI